MLNGVTLLSHEECSPRLSTGDSPILIDKLDKGIRFTLSEFTDNFKLGGSVGLLDIRKICQRGLEGLIDGLRPIERGSIRRKAESCP